MLCLLNKYNSIIKKISNTFKFVLHKILLKLPFFTTSPLRVKWTTLCELNWEVELPKGANRSPVPGVPHHIVRTGPYYILMY